MMLSAGASTGGKVIQESGTFGCPMTGDKNHYMRSETEVTGPNQYVFRSYGKDAKGQEFKGMEILYTRVP
jgi:hypothetical protein